MKVEIYEMRGDESVTLWKGTLTHLPREDESIFLPNEMPHKRRVERIEHLVASDMVWICVK